MSGTGLRRDNQGERPATIKMSERRSEGVARSKAVFFRQRVF